MNLPDDEVGRAPGKIAATGVDLSEPIPIEFAIFSRDRMTSDTINRILICKGSASAVYFDGGEPDFADGDAEEPGPSWTVSVVVVAKPSYDDVIRIQNELNLQIAPLERKVDGWEVRPEEAREKSK